MTEAAMIEFLRGLAAGLGDTPPNAEQWKAIRDRLSRTAPVVAAPPVFIPTAQPWPTAQPLPVNPWPGYPFGGTVVTGHSAALPNTTCCAPNPSFVVGAVGGGALPAGAWGGNVVFGNAVAPGGVSS